LNADRPINFEYMLDMMTDFSATCTSQMMLKSLPFMIKSQSNVIYKYFDHAFYEPPSLHKPIRLPWPIKLHELIFASNTVLITEEILVQEISNKYGK